MLQDHFPEILRFTVSLFPSEDDDVVTSPYNSVLALAKLVEHADAVLPIENQALHDMVAKVDKQVKMASSQSTKPGNVDLTLRGALAACFLFTIHHSDSPVDSISALSCPVSTGQLWPVITLLCSLHAPITYCLDAHHAHPCNCRQLTFCYQHGVCDNLLRLSFAVEALRLCGVQARSPMTV